jgi:hypothetical protein
VWIRHCVLFPVGFLPNQQQLDVLSLNDFFDSDASANECDSQDHNADPSAKSRRRIGLLQPLCQAVHCIALVVDAVDEKGAWRYTPRNLYAQEKGSFFPLIATRVLSFLADLLLTQFGDKATAEENLWQKSFPYGTRTVGTFLDSVLHKVYKQLYGFTIQGYWIERENYRMINASRSSVQNRQRLLPNCTGVFSEHIP